MRENRVRLSNERTDQRIRYAALAASLALQAAALFAGARFVEPRWLHVRHYRLSLPQLPASLDGARLAFLSDAHIDGPGPNAAVTNAAIRQIVAWQPDLILIGGDYYDKGLKAGPEPGWAELPLTAPTFGVLGNHDYFAGERNRCEIVDSLRAAGIDLLVNRTAVIPVRHGKIAVMGVDDPFQRRDDFEAAAATADHDTGIRILLAHAPMIADSIEPGAADLVLAGHTHGSQIRLSPFDTTTPLDINWWLDYAKRKPRSHYQRGFFWVRGSLLYVTTGLGTTSLPMRFFAPPEVNLFTLASGTGDAERPCDDPARYVTKLGLERLFVR
jgi:uncharacterized protein